MLLKCVCAIIIVTIAHITATFAIVRTWSIMIMINNLFRSFIPSLYDFISASNLHGRADRFLVSVSNGQVAALSDWALVVRPLAYRPRLFIVVVVTRYAAHKSVKQRRVAEDRMAFVETGDRRPVYMTTSTIQIFAMLSSVIFLMFGINVDASCTVGYQPCVARVPY